MVDVTIVIPTRDRGRLLTGTLGSALGQRDVTLQVLVIDDGSSDDTMALVEAVRDPRITLVRKPRPEGVSAARNSGIAEALGEWVAFLDDDDLWSPYKLSHQLRTARESKRNWVYAGAVAVNDRLQIISGGPPPEPQRVLEELPYRNLMPAGSSNVLVLKKLLATVGRFDTNLCHLADWDLWIRLGQSCPPAAVKEPLVAYRIHPGNASADGRALDDIPPEMSMIENRYKDLRGGAGVDAGYVLRWIGWNALRRRNRVDAVRAYLRAAATGDLVSLGRAAIGWLHPGVVDRQFRSSRVQAEWMEQAEEWINLQAP